MGGVLIRDLLRRLRRLFQDNPDLLREFNHTFWFVTVEEEGGFRVGNGAWEEVAAPGDDPLMTMRVECDAATLKAILSGASPLQQVYKGRLYLDGFLGKTPVAHYLLRLLRLAGEIKA